MADRLNAYKPAASARVHLLLAALMWTVVGALLLFFGVRWVLTSQTAHAAWLLAVAAAAGVLKAELVLRRAARRTIERIRARGDGRCVGGFLSWQTWAFVGVMAAAGRLLRGGPAPRIIVGVIYAAVGTALLLSVRRLWHAWYIHGTDP